MPRRPPDQQRVDRVPEPRSVQGIADPPGPDEAGGPLPGPDELIEAAGLLEAGDQVHDASGFPGAGLVNGRHNPSQPGKPAPPGTPKGIIVISPTRPGTKNDRAAVPPA